MNKIIYTVDPGVHTAIAVWDGDALMDTKTINSKFSDPVDVITDLRMKFDSILREYESEYGQFTDDNQLWIEGVEVWASSAKSMASATRGNLSLLAYIVGALIGIAQEQDCECHLVSPTKWKGQMNYKILRNVLKKKFNIDTTNDHEASAIGIGLWVNGKL